MNKEELENMRKVINLALIRIGIRCDFYAFAYLCYAVETVILEPEYMQNLCKGLYPKIAEKFEAISPSSVERCIRHAIDNVQDTKSFSELNKMFKTLLYTVDDKPTVGELIKLVSEYYLLGLYAD